MPKLVWPPTFAEEVDGTIFTIVFVLLLYCLVGICVNGGLHKSGLGLLPNVLFWKSLPGLVRDGGRFSWRSLLGLCGARGDYDEVGADDSTWAKADREAARRREDSSFIEGIRESGAHVVPSLVERFPSGSGEWSERDSRKAQRARRKKQLAAGGGAARGATSFGAPPPPPPPPPPESPPPPLSSPPRQTTQIAPRL